MKDRVKQMTELVDDMQRLVLQLELMRDVHVRIRLRAELRQMLQTLRCLISSLPVKD